MDATPRTPTQIRRTSGNAPALPHDWPHRYRPRTGNDAVALGDTRNCDCRTAQLSLTTPPLGYGPRGLGGGVFLHWMLEATIRQSFKHPWLVPPRETTKRPNAKFPLPPPYSTAS